MSYGLTQGETSVVETYGERVMRLEIIEQELWERRPPGTDKNGFAKKGAGAEHQRVLNAIIKEHTAWIRARTNLGRRR